MNSYGIKIRKLGLAQSKLRLLTKENLKELYIKKRLSTIKISKIYKVDRNSVGRLLKYYNINRRDNFGENNGSWAGGHGYEPYSYEYRSSREKILKRDNYVCQLCKDKTLKNNKKFKNKNFLIIHHMDYNKKNNHFNNLITLCFFCNLSVNINRKHWTKYFQNKIKRFK